MLMAAQGCVPKRWRDIAHLVGWWQNAKDPAVAARGWFRDNPSERQLLDTLFTTGRISHPFTGAEMRFARTSLGRLGKNQRYIWLADHMTEAQARALLPVAGADGGETE
jgi:hypothetical protein